MAELLWQQREDTGPASRANSAMAYEASASRTILFGGLRWGFGGNIKAFNDTWAWDGDGWVQLADTGPSPRQFPQLAFDAHRQVIVLFGGLSSTWVSDTWEWDGSAWTQIEDIGPKIESISAGMVYDGARRLTLLSCGSVESGGKGTWTWDGAAWTQVDDGGPSLRGLPGFAYDPEREHAVLFGGGPWAGPYADTWEWDGAVWKQAEDIGPPARSGHSMAWDGKSVLLFGGHSVGAPTIGRFFGDTWAWDGARWRQRQHFGPAPRMSHALAWDAARDRIVVFGGWSGPLFGDTWEAFEKI